MQSRIWLVHALHELDAGFYLYRLQICRVGISEYLCS